MDPELADAYAERDFRQLHKNKTWSRRDQADQNGWERHDHERHGMPYAICTVCEYLRNKKLS